MDQREEYNQELVNQNIKININNYFDNFHSKFYSEIDISFKDYFVELCKTKEKFPIDHSKLKEYGVINNIETSNNIKRALDQYNLKEGEDYRRNVEQINKDNKSRKQRSDKIIYHLSVRSFKTCLIRAKNSNVYLNYYLLLEEVYAFYTDYLLKLERKQSEMKDDKIDQLENKLSEIIEQNKCLLLGVDTLLEKNEELHEDVDILNDKVDVITNIVHDRSENYVPDPNDKTKFGEYILLRNKLQENQYKFIKGQKTHIARILNKKEDENYVVIRKFNSNPVNLFVRFKELVISYNSYLEKEIRKIKNNKDLTSKEKLQLIEEINKEPKIKFYRNDITIHNMTEQDLIYNIEECDDSRLEVEIPE